MNQYFSLIKGFNRNLKLFYASIAMQGFIFFGIYSLLLNLYLLRLGYGPSFIGTVNGVGPIMLAAGSIPAGLLSRRIGSRKGLILGYGIVGIGFCLLPLSQLVPDGAREIWIVSSYALSWLSAALLIVNFSPFVMAETDEAQRNVAFAVMSGLFPVSGFVGSFVGGFLPSFFAQLANLNLDSPLPYQNALIFGGALYLVPAFMSWLTAEKEVVEKQAEQKESNRSKQPLRLLALIGLVSLLIVMGDWVLQLYLNVYLDVVLEVPTAIIGSLLGAGRLLGLTAFVAPVVMGRLGLRRTLFWSAIVSSLTFLPLILIGHWVAAAVSFMALIAVASILNPTFNRFSQSIVEPEWRTTMASAVSMSTGVAIAITAFGGSALIVNFGYRSLFVAGAMLILVGGLLFGVAFGERGSAKVAKPILQD